MAGMILLGTLASFGLVSILWVLSGWILPAGKGAAVVCWGVPDEGILARVKWLQGMGLLYCPLLIIAENDEIISQSNGIEYCSPECLLSRLEQERNR